MKKKTFSGKSKRQQISDLKEITTLLSELNPDVIRAAFRFSGGQRFFQLMGDAGEKDVFQTLNELLDFLIDLLEKFKLLPDFLKKLLTDELTTEEEVDKQIEFLKLIKEIKDCIRDIKEIVEGMIAGDVEFFDGLNRILDKLIDLLEKLADSGFLDGKMKDALVDILEALKLIKHGIKDIMDDEYVDGLDKILDAISDILEVFKRMGWFFDPEKLDDYIELIDILARLKHKIAEILGPIKDLLDWIEKQKKKKPKKKGNG